MTEPDPPSASPSPPSPAPENGRPAIRWGGVFFALACNLLLVTSADLVIGQIAPDLWLALLLRIGAPLLAGVLTALYTQQRGGMHAFIGGMITVPILLFYLFPASAPNALLAGALCAFGGAATERWLRR
ncbi:MAG: hypothetical protein R3C14_39020 [Caldilineaceae bacterium]